MEEPPNEPTLDDATERGERLRAELVESVLPALRAYLERSVGRELLGRESVSDMAQSVCREALRDLDAFRGESGPAFHAWVRSIATNKIARRHRYWTAACRRVIVAADDLGAFPDVDAVSASHVARDREADAALRAALAALPEAYRTAIEVVTFEGRSHRELAEVLGTNEVAARKTYSRARARLGLLLAARAEDDEARDRRDVP